MKPYQLFRLLSSSETDEIVWNACKDDEIPDKLFAGVISTQRLTLSRLEKAPEEVRKSYVRKALRDKRAAELALYVLSSGLTRGSARLIETFLEKVGLPHDGPNLNLEGAIPEPAPEVLDGAIEALLAGFPARQAAIYLTAFAGQPDVSWPGLARRLEEDPRLKLEDRSVS